MTALSDTAGKIKTGLEALGISVKYDDRDNNKPGWKFADYELKGVPYAGNRTTGFENKTVEVARRDTLTKETIPIDKVY